MTGQRSIRPITVTQVLSVMAVAVALYCLVAFGGKSIEAYRLTKWRSELQAEIESMEREAQLLSQEIERRQSPEWLDQALREAGYVPKDAVRVIIVETTPVATGLATLRQTPDPAQSTSVAKTETNESLQLFHNANWEAWKAFLLRFDE